MKKHYPTRFFLPVLLCLALCRPAAKAQVSVTATAGTTGPSIYTTLKGAFDAINAGTHQGTVSVSITASTTETATAALNASGSGSASYTSVTVAPASGATPTVSGSISSGPVVKLNGSSNATINGSNNNTTTRDLSITNTSTTSSNALVIGSVGTTPITNVVVKNTKLTNGTNTSTAMLVGDAAVVGSPGYFNNITIQNNLIQKAYIGLYMYAVVSGTNGSNTLVTGNDLNSTGTNAIRLVAIYGQGLNGLTISNNYIGNFDGVSAEFDRAIWLATGTTNTTISGNTISGLAYTGTSSYAPIGINVSSGVANANITVTGNTLSNFSSSGTYLPTGMFIYSALSGVTVSKNRISNIKNTNTGGYGAAGILLATTTNTANTSINNNFIWDIAGYGYDGYGANDNGNGIVVDGGGGYSMDHNTIALTTNPTSTGAHRASAFLVTANVTAANSINLRDNIFANLQTTGNASSRLALSNVGPSNVFSSINYNDYYSASGNLSSTGTNASISTTLAQLQTSIGGNVNSQNIQPTFVSATDLHLSTATGANNALNSLGTPLAGITTDIDGDPRSATNPDMGADEFTPCPTASFTGQPIHDTVCVGGTASFTATTSNGTAYQWQENTGSGFTNITNNATYSGATTGTLTISNVPAGSNGYTYRCQVTVSVPCAPTASSTVTLTVNPNPSATITPSGSTTFCTGGNVTLGVPTGSNLSYQWKESGNNINGATNASLLVNTAGSYSVVVTNTATGCTATSSTTAVVVGAAPAATITPSGSTSVCQGSTTTLSANSGTGLTYQWLLNGNPINGATNATYAAGSAGSYTVTVSSGPNCNNTSAATTVNVLPLPAATTTPSGSAAICQGSSITLNGPSGSGLSYQWLLNNSNISGATSASYNASAAGSYTIKVTNTGNGCSNTSAAVTVTVNPLPSVSVSPNAAQSICPGDSVVLTASSATATGYQWQQGGSPISNATATGYAAKSAGSYSVKVTDANGCSNTSTAVAVTMKPGVQSEITYATPLAFCEGSAVVLRAHEDPTYSYQWYLDGNPMSGQTNYFNIVSQSGMYTVYVSNTAGCHGLSQPLQVTVYPAPTPVINMNGFTLTTTTYSAYQWFRNTQPIPGAIGQGITATQNGAYMVEVTDGNGCKNRSQVVFINTIGIPGVNGNEAEVLLYPNPTRDRITIESKGLLHLKRISIINGMGSLVYASELKNDREQVVLGHLAAGIYTVQILTDKGISIRRLEVIK